MIPPKEGKSCGLLRSDEFRQKALYILRTTDFITVVDDKMGHTLNASRICLLHLPINNIPSLALLKPRLCLAPVNARLTSRIKEHLMAGNITAFFKVPPHHSRHQSILIFRELTPVLAAGELDQPVRIPRVAHLALHREADTLGSAHAGQTLADGV